MHFNCEPFDKLTPHTLFSIMKGRVDVFVVEQKCPYPELDDVDTSETTQHIYTLDNMQLMSYARCYEKNGQYSAIGRVLVSEHHRGKGIANKLVEQAIACCKTHWPERDIVISAQTYLLDFYESFGFKCTGDAYLEDGIPHQDMVLKINNG